MSSPRFQFNRLQETVIVMSESRVANFVRFAHPVVFSKNGDEKMSAYVGWY
jgi:hypothetical protein